MSDQYGGLYGAMKWQEEVERDNPGLKAQRLLAKIRKIVDNDIPEPDDADEENQEVPSARDRFGGNFDDAYEGGMWDGRTELATEIMKVLES